MSSDFRSFEYPRRLRSFARARSSWTCLGEAVAVMWGCKLGEGGLRQGMRDGADTRELQAAAGRTFKPSNSA